MQEQMCKHNEGFTFHSPVVFKPNQLIGAWWCNKDCRFYLNFNPEYAGQIRFDLSSEYYYHYFPVMPFSEYLHSSEHWSNHGVAYAFDPLTVGQTVFLHYH